MANETIGILKLLMDRKEENLSIRKISQIRDINYKSAYNILKKLKEDNLVNLERMGNTIICSFNNNFNELVFQTEYLRKNNLLVNKDFLIIHNRLAELKFPFIALLFGSYAKRKADKHSDIDILVISNNEKEIKTAISLLPDKIHLTTITYNEFINMAKSKEFSVVSETLKNNVILIGIEEYYRLLKNVG